jgi:hypothetical protein
MDDGAHRHSTANLHHRHKSHLGPTPRQREHLIEKQAGGGMVVGEGFEPSKAKPADLQGEGIAYFPNKYLILTAPVTFKSPLSKNDDRL